MKSITVALRAAADSAKAQKKDLRIKRLDAAIAATERKLTLMKHRRWALLYTGHAQEEA